jgi:alkylhydroperoxidase/carboxymuconolactone decarboxylase family protein YurZ
MAMTSAQDTLRLLTIGDAACLAVMSDPTGSMLATWRLDGRTEALLRLSALIALDAPGSSYRAVVDAALRAGARLEDLCAVLLAVGGMVGSARVISAAPRIALAAGYDVEADLEAVDAKGQTTPTSSAPGI